MPRPHSSLPTSTDRIPPQKDLISSFVSDWVEMKWFYSQFAEVTRELCENMLNENRIRGQVTCRVKNGSRLETKLRERVLKEGKEYRDYSDIRDDIVDLAGVRIALYFPSDYEKIDKTVRDCFSVVKHKRFPDGNWVSKDEALSSEKPTLKRRFGGYSANHYRVRLRSGNIRRHELQRDLEKSNLVIEIQVASVLMHAWAEIDHDLVYKTLTCGPASEEELRLLDAANGLVHTGEVLLQQLQIAMEERVSYQNRPFEDYHKLQEFLQGQIKVVNGPMEDLDILLHILRLIGLDSPWRLGQTFKTGGLAIPAKTEPTQIPFIIMSHALGTLQVTEVADIGASLTPKPFASTEAKSSAAGRLYIKTGIDFKINRQREILERAIEIVDFIRSPKPSILMIENMPAAFKTFNALYNSIQADLRSLRHSRFGDDTKQLKELARQLNSPWAWFEKNNDIHIRVALQLARFNGKNLISGLIELRSSSPLLPRTYAERINPRSHSMGERPRARTDDISTISASQTLGLPQIANTNRPVSILKSAVAERVKDRRRVGHGQAQVAAPHRDYQVISSVVSAASTDEAVTEIWAIDSSEKNISDQTFERLEKAQAGKLTPVEAVKYFKRSGLPNKVLSRI